MEKWLPGELLSGSEHQTPGWFLDMNMRLVISTRLKKNIKNVTRCRDSGTPKSRETR